MLRNLVYRAVATVAGTLASKTPDDFRVLMYHRVEEANAKPHLDSCTLSATPSAFDQQMQYLSRHHAVVSINDVMDAIAGKQKLPSRAVLITFDDAYDCFARNAWPILQRYQLPVILFVATSFPADRQTHYWWDTIHAIASRAERPELKSRVGNLPTRTPAQQKAATSRLTDHFESLPSGSATEFIEELMEANQWTPVENDVMDWNSIGKLVDQGLDLGAHTHRHPLLSQMQPSDAGQEIRDSLQAIRKHTGYEVKSLAYPGGAYNRLTLEICRQLGIELAFTTCRGTNNVRKLDPLQIRRINVGRRATVTKLKAQLLIRPSWFNAMYRLPVPDWQPNR